MSGINIANDGEHAALGRIESFVRKALGALGAWQHHPAAQEATGHLHGALDHIAAAKPAAQAADAAAATQAAQEVEQPAAQAEKQEGDGQEQQPQQ